MRTAAYRRLTGQVTTEKHFPLSFLQQQPPVA